MTSSNSQIKKILITGATNGIGKEVARLLAEKKTYHLIIVARNEQLIKDSIDEFRLVNDKLKVDYYLADFLKLDEVKKVSKKILKDHPVIDYLFQNAAMVPSKKADNQGDLNKAIIVNFLSPLILFETLLSALYKSNEKTVIHTTSMSAATSFEMSDLEKMDTYGRIKAYGITKMMSNMSYYYYYSKDHSITYKLIDPFIVYTNTTKGMMPEWAKWASPLIKLISYEPKTIAKQILKTIELGKNNNITLYKNAKEHRHADIYKNVKLQKEIMQYAYQIIGDK
ncbi:MAG TPA: SDR family NAD(P)-dependent oxidoreductase [Acholeplasma sp.]|nr:SDR family NAD(P)-dependent oxidoreductase [Acholeplasma sp.]